MRTLLVALLIVVGLSLRAEAVPVQVSAITLEPDHVAAIVVQHGPVTTWTIYYFNVSFAVDSAGKPVRNVDAATALAYAKAVGLAPQ